MGMLTDRQPNAFTLIELLAVIALIVLLMSLLLPVMSRVKDKANQVICMSNVRQVTASILLQSGDNNNAVTSPNWGPWAQAGWLTYDYRWTSPSQLTNGLLWPYLVNAAVFRCPADRQQANYPYYDEDTRMLTSYNMNGSVCGFGGLGYKNGVDTNGWITYHVSEFRANDAVYWEGNEDAPGKGWWWDGGNFPWEGIARRHNNGGTLASFDGHVERMDADYYYSISPSTPSVRTRTWNRPYSSNGK